jgi:hypothetical protein
MLPGGLGEKAFGVRSPKTEVGNSKFGEMNLKILNSKLYKLSLMIPIIW